MGRGFWAFKDVQEKKWDSPYKDWFHISFDGNSCYNDGFWYEGWEGHFELVKLNLQNPYVVDASEYTLGRLANPDKIERKWYVVDASEYTLGRLAEVAKVLRGKNKPQFTPHIDTGDYVIVVNAVNKIKVTGKKMDQKIYYNHSDYVGGMKETTLKEMMAKKPEKVVELAVKGMLPKGPLGRSMIKKLHVYAGPEHAQQAQKPVELKF